MLSSIYVTNSIEKLNSYDKKTIIFVKNCALHNNNDDYCQAELSFAEKEIVKIKCVFDTCELSAPNKLCKFSQRDINQ